MKAEHPNHAVDPQTGGITQVARTLRFRLYALLLIVAIPAIGIVIYTGVRDRQDVLDVSRQETRRVTAQIVREQARLITDTRRFLMRLAQVPEIADPDSPECSAFLAQLLPLVPQYANLGVPRADGALNCNAHPLTDAVDVSDRPYFRRAIEGGAFSVGTYQMDRAAKIPSLNFAYPVEARDGSRMPAGAAVAVISLDWWSDLLTAGDLPDGAVSMVIDGSGLVVASHPRMPDLMGKPVSELGISREELNAGGDTVVTMPDGQHLVFSHQTLFGDRQLRKVYMSFGVPVDAGISAANQRALIHLAELFAGLILFWFIAVRLLEQSVFRPLKALNHEIRRLEIGASSGPEDGFAKSDGVPDFDEISQSFRKLSHQREMAEADQRLRSEQMAAILRAIPDTVFRIDRDGGVVDFWSGGSEDLGLPAEDCMGRRVSDILGGDDGLAFTRALESHLETGMITTWEYSIDLHGGRQDYDARICAIAESDERIVVLRNVSQRRQAERRSTIVEERLNRVVSNLPGAVISIDLADPETPRVIYVSDKSTEIWGYTPEQIYTDHTILRSVHSPENVQRLLNAFAETAETLLPFSQRFHIKSADGQFKWVEVHGGASHVEDGEVIVDCIVLDVTSEVDAQQELEAQREVAYRAQKHESVGQLTGGVAHDFNNLLAVILGNLELLRDDLDDEEHLHQVDSSIEAVQRGADLTHKMLAFARKARLEPRRLDMNKVVLQTKSWISRTLPANVEVEASLASGVWAIEADPGSTESALLNLVLNAVEAMPDGGKLTIRTCNITVQDGAEAEELKDVAPGNYVALAVSDTGHGIYPENLANIFDPFYTTKPPSAGSGLGLSMIQGFMDQTGGAVAVTSTPGVGSTFRLFFPAMSETVEAGPVEDLKFDRPRTSAARILIAEDEAEVLAILVATLKKVGYDVASAMSGDEALAMFRADTSFDLLLTDIVMPGNVQGIELSQILRDMKPSLKVVFVSGYAGDAVGDDLQVPEGDTRLMKPVRRDALLSTIEKALSDLNKPQMTET